MTAMQTAAKEEFSIKLPDALAIEVSAPIVTRAHRSQVQIARLSRNHPCALRTEAQPAQDAFLFGIQLADCTQREVWIDEVPRPVSPLAAGSLAVYDLRQRPAWLARSGFDTIGFHVPRAAIDGLMDASGVARMGDLRCEQGVGIDDPVMRELGGLLLPAFQAPGEVSQLFLDNVIIALCVHFAQRYGSQDASRHLHIGGLAPWQERRAKDMLDANLSGAIRISDLASQCGLSVSQFSRSFRKSTGLAPHQWLTKRRVDTAKDILVSREVSLSEISLACGFADQSHFTRVFSRMVGVSPGAWRRNNL